LTRSKNTEEILHLVKSVLTKLRFGWATANTREVYL